MPHMLCANQVEYAACIAPLAATAQAFLEQLQRRRQQQGASPSDQAAPLSYDEEVRGARCGAECLCLALFF